MKNRIISILLSVCMVLTLVPGFTVAVSADVSQQSQQSAGPAPSLTAAGPALTLGAAQEGIEYESPVYASATDVTMGVLDFETLKQSSYSEVTGKSTAWNAGWYVVTEDVTVGSRITVTGDVSLILCDGATLTAAKGITVNDGKGTLTIYGQSEGTGKLVITDSDTDDAGIGGTNGSANGAITINGGIIEASSNTNGAAIGGGKKGDGQNITINGGTVTATPIPGGFGAGIGGGFCADGKNITINGGTVTAKGAGSAAGIGGGGYINPCAKCNASDIIINGGKIYAEGVSGAQAIGKGYYGTSVNNVVVSPLAVYTQGLDPTNIMVEFEVKNYYYEPIYADASDKTKGITGFEKKYISAYTVLTADVLTTASSVLGEEGKTTWYFVSSEIEYDSRITVSGNVNLVLVDKNYFGGSSGASELIAHKGITVETNDTLTIYGQEDGTGKLTIDNVAARNAGIGCKDDPLKWMDSSGAVTINGGIITVTGGENAAAIGGSPTRDGKNITINGGTVKAIGGGSAAAIGGGQGGSAESITVNGGFVEATAGSDGAWGIGRGNGIEDCHHDYKISIADTLHLYMGVNRDAALAATPTKGGDIKIGDDVNAYISSTPDTRGTKYMLVTATHSYESPVYNNEQYIEQGISGFETKEISESYHVVTETDLTWEGGWYVVDHTIEIADHITVTGDVKLLLCDGATLVTTGYIAVNEADGGSLTVYGQSEGTGKLAALCVTAYNIAAIGGENQKANGAITINGGVIYAKGGNSAAAIGGGCDAVGKNITINGGTVTAIASGANAPGIGGPNGAQNITVNGGRIYAKGSSNGQAIGKSTSSASGVIVNISPLAVYTKGKAPSDEEVELSVYASYNYPVYNFADTPSSGINEWKTKILETGVTFVSPGSAWGEEGKDTYYVVTETLQLSSRVVVSGNVHLLLLDGVTLTVPKGITVNNGEGTLTIYGQKDGTGKLVINQVDKKYAGIGGGGQDKSNGAITVNGGTVEVNGGKEAAAIGGGNGGNGKDIIINGGTVNATGDGNGAGIGGGWCADGQYITINGGTVTATGGENGAGIGGGNKGGAMQITVNDGTVTAQGGAKAAGIGGGDNGEGQYITVNGGSVKATGGTGGAGIGGGCSGKGSDITLAGGRVEAIGNTAVWAMAIGSGNGGGSSSNINVTSGIDIYVGDNLASAHLYGTQDNEPTTENNYNFNFAYLLMENGVRYQAPIYNKGSDFAKGICGFTTENKLPGAYQVVTATDVWNDSVNDGWYAVTEDVTIDTRITVTGDVNLILCDGATLTASKGITVNEGDGLTLGTGALTIYGQSEGTGKLVIDDVEASNAGIGGTSDNANGVITINGGTLEVTARNDGAAIGGGESGDGKNITINGGTVTATGGYEAAGIGGGTDGNGKNITVNGGTVTATGAMDSWGNGGAGIGGGAYSPASDITINGGKIYAKAGTPGAEAIGKGTGTGSATGVSISPFAAYTINSSDEKEFEVKVKYRYPTYVDNDATKGIESRSLATATSFALLTSEDTTWGQDGKTTWYVVTDTDIADRITVKGDVNLILPDGYTLHAPKGITVTDNNSLTVYGGELGTGKLVIDDVDTKNAGIGGNGYLINGENITINGGTVEVTGGANAAGIGGGKVAAGNKIVINGGTVTATGGENGAGIGGGDQGGDAENIIINGGTVNANGNKNGAGIGGGNGGSGKYITVNGGNVKATGGRYGGAGIGGGAGYGGNDGTNITVNGGNVLASGSPAIGGGSDDGKTSDINIAEALDIYNGDSVDELAEYTGSDVYAALSSSVVSLCAPITVTVPSYVEDDPAKGIASTSEKQYIFGQYTFVTSTDVLVTLTSGVYAVTEDATISGRITVEGDVVLVLCDGVTLTAPKGITVNEGEGTLTVYGEAENTGKLVINNVEGFFAGIGGANGKANGAITVCGGTVEVTGGSFAAAIGGGIKATGSDIVISGGIVMATGDRNGAGIGGGNEGMGSDIVINGGVVMATGSDYAAAIGGGSFNAGENITICGGTVTAKGGQDGAAIGGGYKGVGQNITVSGGTVTAKGGTNAAGIGGGQWATGSDITISGGTVTATGGDFGAGIGGGQKKTDGEKIGGDGVNITISGGTVTATGGASGAGIGGGYSGIGESITISGGTVNAKAGQFAAAIGGGQSGAGRNITISGGTVTAKGGNSAAGIGGGYSGAGENITICGGTVTAYGGASGAGIGCGSYAFASDITISGGQVYAKGGSSAAGIGGGYNASAADSASDIEITGGIVVAYGGESAAAIGGGVNGKADRVNVNMESGAFYAFSGEKGVPAIGSGKNGATATDITFINGTESSTYTGTYSADQTEKNVTELIGEIDTEASEIVAIGKPLTYSVPDYKNPSDNEGALSELVAGISGMHSETKLPGSVDIIGALDEIIGSMAGECDYTIVFDTTVLSRLTSRENNNLIIPDGLTLSIPYGIGMRNGDSLTIYGGPENTGKLVIDKVDDDKAGIGGDLKNTNGVITVNGATLDVTGGKNASAIGGRTTNGIIVINAGTVKATGGENAAAIGSGLDAESSFVIINGGTVLAQGGENGAGIGSGENGTAKMIYINGGTVIATGSDFAAGIGAGKGGDLGMDSTEKDDSPYGVAVSGGNVTAIGGTGAAGIGAGEGGNAYHIYVVNGEVKATAGAGAAGIGAGKPDAKGGGNAGYIGLNGGNVTAVSASGEAVGRAGTGTVQNMTLSNLYTVTGSAEGHSFEAVSPATVTYQVPVYKNNDPAKGVDHYEAYEASAPTALAGCAYLGYLGATGTDMWYVVTADTEINQLTVIGNVHLLLTDGTELKSTEGVIVEQPNTLSIYGGEENTGKLAAGREKNAAGIGGRDGKSNGAITINGGDINVSESVYWSVADCGGAGIGGGRYATGSDIVINGGTVFAEAANYNGAGIGGGQNAAGTHIVINGGNVQGAGGQYGAGIGGGSNATGSDIVINGGTVQADGRMYSAAIGGGFGGPGIDITINGGMINATGSGKGAGIGGGDGAVGKNITINAGLVRAKSDSNNDGNAAGIGGGNGANADNIRIGSEAIVLATAGGANADGIGSGEGGAASTNIFAPTTSTVKQGLTSADTVVSNSGGDLSSLLDKQYVNILGPVEYLVPNYVDAKDVTKGITGMTKVKINDYELIEDAGSTLGTADKDSYYLSLSEYENKTERYEVLGNVHLILADGSSCTLRKGITVAAGNSLTVYGQDNNSGYLDAGGSDSDNMNAGIGSVDGANGTITFNGGYVYAYGGNQAAGIGTGHNYAAENIIINGGHVSAHGKNGGAGIGGGVSAVGRNITINGGEVFAEGGEGGAGIGGGNGAEGSNIVINGGEVNATGGYQGAGIGGGKNATCITENIVITGGEVTATGGENGGAAIGGGCYASAKNITISGGEVTAEGSKFSSGIGAGSGNDTNFPIGSNITISGGTVKATGGKYGAGIGSGQYGSAHDITISGGEVTAEGGDTAAGIGGGGHGEAYNIEISGGKVTATGGIDGAGIGGGKYGSAHDITISGGEVTANGAPGLGQDGGAGIGGGSFGNASGITISGGKVTVQGGKWSAGIGSGCGTDSEHPVASNITISGGEVTAKGGKYGAGIGSGDKGVAHDITISGGTVKATGGEYGAGIGGGNKSIGYAITVSGGEVTANGGFSAAGIGGGDGCEGYGITVSGGEVTATGGRNAAGIGGGEGKAGYGITISGGKVKAEGGYDGAGIGGGKHGEGYNITISDGDHRIKPGNWAAGIGGGDYAAGHDITISGGKLLIGKSWNAVAVGNGDEVVGDAVNINIKGLKIQGSDDGEDFEVISADDMEDYDRGYILLSRADSLSFKSASEFSVTIPAGAWTNIEYSYDMSEWTAVTAGTPISAGASGSEYILYLRGKGNTAITGADDKSLAWVLTTTEENQSVQSGGDLTTLIDYEDPDIQLSDYAFAYMFSDWKALTTVPGLSSEKLAKGCYKNLFAGIEHLTVSTTAPTSGDYVAWDFSGCTAAEAFGEGIVDGTNAGLNMYYVSGAHTINNALPVADAEANKGYLVISSFSASMGKTITVTGVPGTVYSLGSVTVSDGTNTYMATKTGNRTFTFVMPNVPVTITGIFDINPDKVAFEEYKKQLVANMDGLLITDDSDVTKKLLETGKPTVLAVEYDEDLCLLDNMNRADAQRIVVNNTLIDQRYLENYAKYQASLVKQINELLLPTDSADIIAEAANGIASINGLAYRANFGYDANIAGLNEIAQPVIEKLRAMRTASGFDAYRKEVAIKANALQKADDSEASLKLISDAVDAIMAITVGKNETVDAAKARVDAVYDNLVKALNESRAAEFDAYKKQRMPSTPATGSAALVTVLNKIKSDITALTYNAASTMADNKASVDMLVSSYEAALHNVAYAEITLGEALIYNGSEQTMEVKSVTVGGVSATCLVTGNSQTHAGVYTITIIGSGEYTGTATVSYEIARKKATVTIDDKDSLVGEQLESLSYTAEGILEADKNSVVLTCNADMNKAGSYAIEATCSSSDYNVEYVAGTYTVYMAGVENNGVKIDSENGLPENTEIVVELLDMEEATEEEVSEKVKEADVGEKREILRLYNIELLCDGAEIQPNGKVRITIDLPEDLWKEENLAVVHIDDEGNVTDMNAQREDNKLIFTTDHFSFYAITGEKSASLVWLWIPVALVAVYGAGYGFYYFGKLDGTPVESATVIYSFLPKKKKEEKTETAKASKQ